MKHNFDLFFLLKTIFLTLSFKKLQSVQNLVCLTRIWFYMTKYKGCPKSGQTVWILDSDLFLKNGMVPETKKLSFWWFGFLVLTLPRLFALRDSSMRFSTCGFFHKSVVPGPLIHILKYFCHLLLFRWVTSVCNGMLLKFFFNKSSFLSSIAILKLVF